MDDDTFRFARGEDSLLIRCNALTHAGGRKYCLFILIFWYITVSMFLDTYFTAALIKYQENGGRKEGLGLGGLGTRATVKR